MHAKRKEEGRVNEKNGGGHGQSYQFYPWTLEKERIFDHDIYGKTSAAGLRSGNSILRYPSDRWLNIRLEKLSVGKEGEECVSGAHTYPRGAQ